MATPALAVQNNSRDIDGWPMEGLRFKAMNEPPRDALCRVMDAMDKAGVTRGDLISRGIASRNALQQAFCRRRPLSPELLGKIAEALGVAAEDLQGEESLP